MRSIRLSYIIVSSHIVNSVCWSHALVKGPTSKRRAALSSIPHFFMDALYRPTPVRSLFRVVQCFRLRSSPLMPSTGSDTWRCTHVGPDASHSCFHVAAIHSSFDWSPGMTLLLSIVVVRFTGVESAWRHFIRCRVVQDVPGCCFPPYAC